MTTPRPATILAVAADDDRYDHVRRRAIERARERQATLLLWDVDAGKRLLESPMPTNWSAQGEEEQFGDRLTINDLEALGRAPLADQVREARSAGVQAYGWLPERADAESLRDYAVRQRASLVVVPDDQAELADDLGTPVELVGVAEGR